jgi:hypothetical protein
MARKRKPVPPPEAQPGRDDAAGAAVNPADLPATPETPANAPPAGAVNQGLPISPAEYERLQREARTRKLPPADCAQEDSPGP